MLTRGKFWPAAVIAATTIGLAACSPSQPTALPTPTADTAPSGVSTPEPSHDYKPGAAGIGDPYFPTYGNGGYDVASYAIKVKYDPKTDILTGDATITAAATQDLSSFNLDLAGLTVRSVTVDDTAASSSRQANELTVTPAHGIATGATFVTHVLYDGVPKPVQNKYKDLGEGGWFATPDGAIALGQPDSAASWYPVNDHPLDKAVYTIEATVPTGLTAVSNGTLAPTTTAGVWTTWTWSETKPMASYLATLVIGKFRVTTGTHNGKPVYSAVTTKIAKGVADTSIDHTVKVADFLETQFGPYPFDSYGGVVISDDRIHFALETQSRPVYSAGFFKGGVNDWVIAHELAHQWFGDDIAVHHWEDIWLNEGFASYAEWLWNEHAGVQSVQKTFDQIYRGSTPDVWATPPGRPGAAHIFDTTVYDRGAMTLHALRKAVGDTAFFTIVKQWATDKAGGNGTTAEFVALAEKVSGKKLDTLFNAWLYGKTKPKL